MDDVDQRLISALRHDARASLSDLALTLGVSRTTVRGRIEKLRRLGDIVGFTVVLKGDAARDPVRGLMMIGIEGRGTDRILRQLNGLSAVQGPSVSRPQCPPGTYCSLPLHSARRRQCEARATPCPYPFVCRRP